MSILKEKERRIFGQLRKYIAKFAGHTQKDLDEFRVFINFSEFDASDTQMCAFMREVDKDNDNDWHYRYFKITQTKEPSIVFWEIEELETYAKASERFCNDHLES